MSESGGKSKGVTLVSERTVLQGNDGLSEDFRTKFLTETQKPNVLPLWQIDPNICVERCRRRPLQDRRSHPGDLKPNFVRSECLNKPCERRKF